MRLAIRIMVLAAVMVAIGCGTREKTEVALDKTEVALEETRREGTETARPFTAEDRSEYRKKLETHLDDLDRRMQELDREIQEASQELKEDLREDWQALSDQRNGARQVLRDLDATSADTWDEVKRRADAALDELEAAYENIRSRLE